MSIYAHFLALEMSLVKSATPTKQVVFSRSVIAKNIDLSRSIDSQSTESFRLCKQESVLPKTLTNCSFSTKSQTITPDFNYFTPTKLGELPPNWSSAKPDIDYISLDRQDISELIDKEDNPLQLPTKPQQLETNLIPLTLKDAQKLAAVNNRQLKITQLELKRAQSALQAERAAWFPSFSVQSGLNRSLDPSGEIQVNTQKDRLEEQAATIPILESQLAQLNTQLAQPNLPPIQQAEGQIALAQLQGELQQAQDAQNQINSVKNFATTTINGSVGLQYAIFSPQRQAAIKIAREQVKFNELEVDRIQDELNLQVAEAYYNLQQSDREVEIAENDVATRRTGVKIVSRLLEAALATRLDLLNAEVELDNAIQVLRNSQTQQQVSRRNLAQLLSLPADITPTAADKVNLGKLWQLSLEETILLALENRVELEQQLAQRRSGKAQRQAAWSAIKPQVNLFANYDFLQLYSDEPGDNVLKGFGDGYSLGVNFNWTLWDGGAALARAKEATSVTEIAEQSYAQNADSIRFEVEQAYFQLPSTLENVETATEAVNRAKQAVAAAEIRFKANLNTQTEVLDAQNRLIQAENNLIQATLGYNRALATLKRAVGN